MTEIGNWTNAQVCSWLKAVQLGNVVPLFKEHLVDGPLLLHLDDGMLTELGVDSKVDYQSCSCLYDLFACRTHELLAANPSTFLAPNHQLIIHLTSNAYSLCAPSC